MALGNIVKRLPFEVRQLADKVHIVPGIKHNLLSIMNQVAEAKYITFFDEDQVNIYDATNKKSEFCEVQFREAGG